MKLRHYSKWEHNHFHVVIAGNIKIIQKVKKAWTSFGELRNSECQKNCRKEVV